MSRAHDLSLLAVGAALLVAAALAVPILWAAGDAAPPRESCPCPACPRRATPEKTHP